MSIKFNSTNGILKFTSSAGLVKLNDAIPITSTERLIMYNNTGYELPTTTTLSTSDIKNIKINIFNLITKRSTNGTVITPTAFNIIYECYFFLLAKFGLEWK